MTSPIPGLITWPVLTGLALVLAGRWWLLRDGIVDRLINRGLAAALAEHLLREAWFEQSLAWLLPGDDSDVVNIARQLSLGATVLAISNIYGIAKLWAGADPAHAWRRQRRYYLVTITVTAVILIAGTPARRADQLIDQALGWPAVVVWVAFSLPLGAMAMLVGRVSVRELRTVGDTTWQERALYTVVLCTTVGTGLVAVACPIEAISSVMTGRPSFDPEMHWKAWSGFLLSAVGAPAAITVPLISTVLTRIGWDRTGRYCRRLQPIWIDLTAAVPEIVLEMRRDQNGRTDPAIRLHRMTVEIRDSLLHLKRYSDSPDDLAATGGDPHIHARRIAEAIATKAAGHPPSASLFTPRHQVQPGARDLTAELRQLLALAEAWPYVRGLADSPLRHGDVATNPETMDNCGRNQTSPPVPQSVK
ncbi:MAB_1171c family putative transporter [Nocardia anaemiae]|uniref:MAB_1171c family putative transporter n=1 Tax=Nocardia anaemiae TaxID=263910 RepID=UPI0007A4A336|nr:MAB_1171c family putative transporter [Nocardia anaemiae]